MEEIEESYVRAQPITVLSGSPAQTLNKEDSASEAARARAMPALGLIVEAIRRNPTTGQGCRLVRFLAGLYDGALFPFDLTHLRALDHRLADACLAVLAYDRFNCSEIHYWGQVTAKEMKQWFLNAGLYYQVQQRRLGRELYNERFPEGHQDEGLSD